MIELIRIERLMISAKYDGKKIKYWWYKRKYNKLKGKLNKTHFYKK